MRHYIYEHIREDNKTIFYIGVGTKSPHHPNNPYVRAKAKTGRNKIWKNIVAKTNYTINILKEFDDYEEALKEEHLLIKKYGRICNNSGCLANLSEGGRGSLNYTVSEETKQKIAKRLKGRKIPKEHLIKQTIAKKTHVFQYDYEGNLIREYFNIEECIKENPEFVETSIRSACLKQRASAYGFQWRHLHNNTISPYYPEKRVIQLDKDNEIIQIYKSIDDCSKQLSLTKTNIYTIIRRKQFFKKQYYLKYENMQP